MPEFLSILRDIVLLRRGPQDLPYSPSALGTVAVATVAVSGIANSLLGEGMEVAMVRTAVLVALSLGLLYLLLLSQQRQARFNQTALASLLVSAVFSLVLLPVLALSGPLPTPGTPPESVTGTQMLSMLLIIIAGLWKFVIDAHILRHALEIRFMPALLIAFAMELAVTVLVSALFGKPPEGA
ncbi:hypothetical protein [Tahibacter harae]|uniref:Yip1 domain-containing protein n=1 Tax=Tahibacter harae TaxID=2963937 RepID=A0ABT1QYS0_9GAMM|nr:hypothetical protein [Tahibacter harae]MCQ4167436.1 hypothetical protein [Tahibacter harae]